MERYTQLSGFCPGLGSIFLCLRKLNFRVGSKGCIAEGRNLKGRQRGRKKGREGERGEEGEEKGREGEMEEGKNN